MTRLIERPTSRWGRYRLISGRIFDADRTAIDNKGWHDQQFRSLSEPAPVSPGLRIFPCRRLIQNLREASGTHGYQERFLAYCKSSSRPLFRLVWLSTELRRIPP